MTDTQPGSASGATAATSRRGGPFARLLVFLREVVGELKKVVYPTRDELVTYTSVVLVFVAVVMTYVSLLDLGFGRLVFWVLGAG
ncbi:preprotein translocase subunit SecE [Quadrisphaera granulorum]|uniref:Protein translocase subunit SecE n=1 Tax=Quadrisphaera granulorum TaxID=317664 RepID=A0A316AZ29_9ACTN|nr:preprotein translocase subunit SecE [Quadrisphaera granulorum]PWJ55487.1 preprotein translocase subunit SecE [Quadrisphaera granulorum]SZE95551.1 preprotein translocase subunit SecE [Quadrisphaera granulorum]